jgi:hypothetical protein
MTADLACPSSQMWGRAAPAMGPIFSNAANPYAGSQGIGSRASAAVCCCCRLLSAAANSGSCCCTHLLSSPSTSHSLAANSGLAGNGGYEGSLGLRVLLVATRAGAAQNRVLPAAWALELEKATRGRPRCAASCLAAGVRTLRWRAAMRRVPALVQGTERQGRAGTRAGGSWEELVPPPSATKRSAGSGWVPCSSAHRACCCCGRAPAAAAAAGNAAAGQVHRSRHAARLTAAAFLLKVDGSFVVGEVWQKLRGPRMPRRYSSQCSPLLFNPSASLQRSITAS